MTDRADGTEAVDARLAEIREREEQDRRVTHRARVYADRTHLLDLLDRLKAENERLLERGAELEAPACVIEVDERRMGGLPCLAHTRLPMSQLAGYTVDEIMEGWPYLDRELVERALALWANRDEWDTWSQRTGAVP